MSTRTAAWPRKFAESVAAVRESRASRIGDPRLLPNDDGIVSAFHPDNDPGCNGVIGVGPNAGDRAPHELVNLLTASSILDPASVSMFPTDTADLLILGSGGAGLAAALMAHDLGVSVTIATKLRMGDSNTTMATGMACPVGDGDSVDLHVADTLATGRHVGHEPLIRSIINDGPSTLRWLERLGVGFEKDSNGDFKVFGHGGGHSTSRTLCAPGGLTGMEIIRALRREVRSRDIRIMQHAPAMELLMDDNDACAGAVLLKTETRELKVVRAKLTLIATGGIGQLRVAGFPTTNHHGATGDGLAIAYRAGARLRDVGSVQYHPTGSIWPRTSTGWLLTEGLRQYGADLVNRAGDRFVDERGVRDSITAAIIRECQEGRGVRAGQRRVGVWLDTPLLRQLEPDFQSSPIVAKYRRIGVDPCTDPMLVYPVQHYHNGGLAVDEWGRTTVPNLLAAGEVAGGMHGRNRMGGNSLLEVLVAGRRAGRLAGRSVTRLQVPSQMNLHHASKHGAQARDRTVNRAPILFPYPIDATRSRFNLG